MDERVGAGCVAVDLIFLAENSGVSGDEPAVAAGGAEDGSFLGIVLHDEVVAYGGGIVSDNAPQVGGGEL